MPTVGKCNEIYNFALEILFEIKTIIHHIIFTVCHFITPPPTHHLVCVHLFPVLLLCCPSFLNQLSSLHNIICTLYTLYILYIIALFHFHIYQPLLFISVLDPNGLYRRWCEKCCSGVLFIRGVVYRYIVYR